MSADWTACRVVRDCDGDLWGHDVVGWRLLGERPFLLRLLSTEALATLGPIIPVLDADGQPVVTTVGDLTARHIGRRVRLDEHYDAKLETIFAHEGGKVALNFTHAEGFTYGCSRTIGTPCEVLP